MNVTNDIERRQELRHFLITSKLFGQKRRETQKIIVIVKSDNYVARTRTYCKHEIPHIYQIMQRYLFKTAIIILIVQINQIER